MINSNITAVQSWAGRAVPVGLRGALVRAPGAQYQSTRACRDWRLHRALAPSTGSHGRLVQCTLCICNSFYIFCLLTVLYFSNTSASTLKRYASDDSLVIAAPRRSEAAPWTTLSNIRDGLKFENTSSLELTIKGQFVWSLLSSFTYCPVCESFKSGAYLSISAIVWKELIVSWDFEFVIFSIWI